MALEKSSYLFPNFIFLFVFCTIISVASSQESCVNPRNEAGTCILYTQCPELLNLIQNRYRKPEETRYLSSSICGNENSIVKVCCKGSNQKCTNPNGVEGECKSLNECASIQHLLTKPMATEAMNYLKKSVCVGLQFNICCTNAPPVISRISTDTKVELTNPPHPDIDKLLPKAPDCGLEAGQSDRIFGGNVTRLDQYPWMALVEFENINRKRSFSCGGSLISKRYILTAAHCVTGPVLRQVGNPISVRLGEFDRGNPGKDCLPTGIPNEQDCNDEPKDIPVEKIIFHPLYDSNKTGSKHDIALLRLASEVEYTDFIIPICLPESDVTINPPSDLTLFTAGWGTTETGKGSNKKLHVELPLTPLKECGIQYKKYNVDLWHKQLCAGGIAGKDSCRGDSGGPLMHLVNDAYSIHGVVSFGPTPCAQSGVPGVYSKVYEYLGWIRGEIKP